MDARAECCIARYAGNMFEMSRMNRIMMRYRPIAPKPELPVATSGSSGSGSPTTENSCTYVKTGQRKRRSYVRNRRKNDRASNGGVTKRCKYKSGEKKRKSSSTEENESNGRSTVSTGSVSGGDWVVTLPLLSETPDKKKSNSNSNLNIEEYTTRGALWLDFEGSARVVKEPAVRVVETWVKVECITEQWPVGVDHVYGGGVGWEEEEEEELLKLMNLERDTCPWFVSDGGNRATWVNKAYREMVLGQVEMEEEVLVQLVMKEGLQLPPKNYGVFTCMVRVVTCGKGNSSLTLPCDVWRINGGQGFAWRLDTKAALSLGR